MLDSNPAVEHDIITHIENPKKRELEELDQTCGGKRLQIHTDE